MTHFSRLLGIGLLLSLGAFNSLIAVEAFDSLVVGTSAKVIGIGSVQGFDSSAAGVFENPASLSKISGISISGFTTSVMDVAKYNNLAVAFRTEFGNVGFGAAQVSVDDIPNTPFGAGLNSQLEVVPVGAFAYRSIVVKGTYQVDVQQNLSLGVTGTYRYSEIYTTYMSGTNADLGLLWDSKPVQVSLVLKDVLANQGISFSSGAKENIPMTAQLGMRYGWKDWQFFGQTKSERGAPSVMKSLGVKFQPTNDGQHMYFSMGYHERNTPVGVKGNLAVGLGLEFKTINLYFAYEKSEIFKEDNKYYFSTTVNL